MTWDIMNQCNHCHEPLRIIIQAISFTSMIFFQFNILSLFSLRKPANHYIMICFESAAFKNQEAKKQKSDMFILRSETNFTDLVFSNF